MYLFTCTDKGYVCKCTCNHVIIKGVYTSNHLHYVNSKYIHMYIHTYTRSHILLSHTLRHIIILLDNHLHIISGDST